jgi:hypothetical protein
MKIKQALTLLFAVVTLFAVQAQTKTKAKAPAKVPAFKCDHAFQDFEEKITAKEYTNALNIMQTYMFTAKLHLKI